MGRLDKGDTLHFLFVGPEKSYALLQSLYVVKDARAGVAWSAHPSTKCRGFVTVIEVELCKLAAALTKLRFRRAPLR